jgi:hypothetical protein
LLRIVFAADPAEIMDADTGRIKDKYICSPSEHAIDYSCSLLGIYSGAHICLHFTEQGKHAYMHYCPPDEEVNVPVRDVDFTENEDRNFFCIPISRLDGIPFPFKQSDGTVTITCRVTHTPMRWNFWHFSLHWQSGEQIFRSIQSKQDKRIAQKIGHAFRNEMSMLVKLGLPDNYNLIDPARYSKN